jgi:hypothetical protein
MANCIIKNCEAKSCELFGSPQDRNKLKVWQTICKTQETEFLICNLHFESRFIGTEKFLVQNAFPSILIDPDEDFQNSKKCQACLRNFEAETKHSTAENIREIFRKATGFQVRKKIVIKSAKQYFSNFAYVYS